MSLERDLALHRRLEAELVAPGAPFETRAEPVLGVEMSVFRERLPSLRAFLDQSAAFGDREYIVCEDRRISFAEHRRQVADLAAALHERFGVGPGDRVAILAANGPEWIVSWWAAVSLGAVAVAFNGWWVADEILYALEDSEPTVLIGDARRLARIAGHPVRVPVVEMETDFEPLLRRGAGATAPEPPLREDDPACILYTSGTTGRPKGAVNTHRNIVALNRLHTYHGLRLLKIAMAKSAGGAPPPPANCTLVSAPLFHLSGLYTGAVTLLASGVKTVWTRGRFDPVRVMELIEQEKVTSWGPLGTMAHRVLHHPDLGRYDLSSIRQVGSGGAPIPVDLLDRMREAFPNARAQIGLGYGLTEATGMATINFGSELEARPDSVGRILPTFDAEIRDPDGKPLSEGAEGEIHLRGPLVMRDYWRRPDATAETILPGRWLRTGDWGRLEDGFLYVNSRKRDLILRGGENVYPAEIEHRLETHPGVLEAAVIGVDHPELGQEVKAVVVPRPGSAAPLDPEALGLFVAERLAYFKVPAHWEVRETPLPRNATGKVLKHLLENTGRETPFVEE